MIRFGTTDGRDGSKGPGRRSTRLDYRTSRRTNAQTSPLSLEDLPVVLSFPTTRSPPLSMTTTTTTLLPYRYYYDKYYFQHPVVARRTPSRSTWKRSTFPNIAPWRAAYQRSKAKRTQPSTFPRQRAPTCEIGAVVDSILFRTVLWNPKGERSAPIGEWRMRLAAGRRRGLSIIDAPNSDVKTDPSVVVARICGVFPTVARSVLAPTHTPGDRSRQ